MNPSKPDIHTRFPRLSDPSDQARYKEAMNCNRCGFCTSHCPTYLATGEEALSPRGRNQAFRALLEGRLKDPSEAERAFSTCLQCGICTSVCFAEVPTAKLMSAARGTVMAAQGESLLLKFVLRFLLPRPWILEPLMKAFFLGKRLGLSRWLNRAGLLRRISLSLSAAEEMVETAPLRFLRSRLRVPPVTARTEVIQFLACGPNYIRPTVGEATARLLKTAGARSGCAANVCCGLPAVSLGDLDAARALAKKNIVLFEKFPQAVVLVDDSSCAAAVKDYPGLFEQDPVWKSRAEEIARRTQDLTEWKVKRGGEQTKREGGGLPSITVTYHDPCKARYAQKIVDPPRRILASLPSTDYRELPEADQCCGGGGTHSFVHPEISRAVLDRKIKNIESTGAAAVLTSSVSCLLQVQFGLRRKNSSIEAMHISEFLVRREQH